MGKGIFVPVKVFTKKYNDVIKFINSDDEIEIAEKIVQKCINETLEVSTTGHDAFQGRWGFMSELFDDTEHGEAASRIYDLIQEAKEIPDDSVPFTTLFCGNLMFIGKVVELGSKEFSWYVKTPEIIYGMSHLLPDIVKEYPQLKELELPKLREAFNQEPKVWFFSSDCGCCG